VEGSTNAYTQKFVELFARQDVQIKTPTKKWTKYVSFKKYAKQMSIPWSDCQGAIPGGPHNGYTSVHFQTQGFPEGIESPLAYLKVDYYVTFRGQFYSS